MTNILILVPIYKFIMDLFFSSGSPAHYHQDVEVSILIYMFSVRQCQASFEKKSHKQNKSPSPFQTTRTRSGEVAIPITEMTGEANMEAEAGDGRGMDHITG